MAPRTSKRPTPPSTLKVHVPEKIGKKPKEDKHLPKVQKKSGSRYTESGAATPWYLLEGKEAADALFSRVNGLRLVQLTAYRREVLENMRLYAGSMNVNGTRNTLFGKQLRYNLIKSITDTGASMMSAARTLPFCQTRGANWKLRRKVLLRNQAIQQQVQAIGLFEEVDKAIIDALVCRLGAVKFFEDSDTEGAMTACERVLPLSLIWDPQAAVTGEIRELHHIAPYNRDVLIELYPEHMDCIKRAPGPGPLDKTDFQLETSSDANLVMVYEGWKLPSAAEAKDGRHSFSIQGAELIGDEWTTMRLPFGILRGWEPPQLGLPGVSLVDVCKPAQLRIEQLADHVQRCQTLGSTARVFLKKGSMVEPEQVTNSAVQIHLYDGDTPPAFFTVDATPHDLEATIENIREQTLSMLGMTQQQVAGQTPTGVTSAVGQRAAEDISSKRHVRPLRFLERFLLQCSQAMVDTNDRVALDNPAFQVDRAARNAWLLSSKWKDIMVEPTEAKMAVLPVSQLVGSTAAQFDTVQSWVEAGWCTQQTAKMLSAMPDTEGQADDDTEDTLYSQFLIDQVLDNKVVGIPPELDVAVFGPLLRTEYLKAKREGADPEVLTQFRRLMDTVKGRADAVAAANAPPPPDPGTLPPMGPGPGGPGAIPGALPPGGDIALPQADPMALPPGAPPPV
jgi:hypothetical protein